VFAESASGPPGLVVYLDRSDIHQGALAELKAGIRRLVQFIESAEPQLMEYGFYIAEDTAQMTVVAVHPDSASLELHLEIGRDEFRKLAHLITLRETEVFGSVSPHALEMLRQKASALGGSSVRVHERFAGFTRPLTPRAR
jgi:hypothetical protein